MVGSGKVSSLWPLPPLSGQRWFISHSDNRRCQGLCTVACLLGSHRGSTLPLAFEPWEPLSVGGGGVLTGSGQSQPDPGAGGGVSPRDCWVRRWRRTR